MNAETSRWPDAVRLDAAAGHAARAIPPAWPLASSVAVNPFLGQTDESIATVGARLARVAGVPITMPRSWYQARITSGLITDADLSDALASAPAALRPANLAALKSAALVATAEISAAPTIADLAAEVSGIDWPGLIAERFGAWAAGYFDEGQALWAAPRGRVCFSLEVGSSRDPGRGSGNLFPPDADDARRLGAISEWRKPLIKKIESRLRWGPDRCCSGPLLRGVSQGVGIRKPGHPDTRLRRLLRLEGITSPLCVRCPGASASRAAESQHDKLLGRPGRCRFGSVGAVQGARQSIG